MLLVESGFFLTMAWASSGLEGNMTNDQVAISKAHNALD